MGGGGVRTGGESSPDIVSIVLWCRGTHIYVTENEPETNQDTLKDVIEECPYDQDDKEK